MHARFMQRSVQEIQVALRVLSALTYREIPHPQDLEELHRIISAANYDSLDEMACAVIEQALEHRRRVRDAGLNAEDQLTERRIRPIRTLQARAHAARLAAIILKSAS
jgi:hypothetical protein